MIAFTNWETAFKGLN